MKIELDNIEIAHISSLIHERKETIAKILNAIQEDNDEYLKNYYKKENRIIDEIESKLQKGVKKDDYKEERTEK